MPVIGVVFGCEQLLVPACRAAIIFRLGGQGCCADIICLVHRAFGFVGVDGFAKPCDRVGILALLRQCVRDQEFDIIPAMAHIIGVGHQLFCFGKFLAVIGNCAFAEGVFGLHARRGSRRRQQQVDALFLKRQVFDHCANIDGKHPGLIPIVVRTNCGNDGREIRFSACCVLGLVQLFDHRGIGCNERLRIIPLGRSRSSSFLALFFFLRLILRDCLAWCQ